MQQGDEDGQSFVDDYDHPIPGIAYTPQNVPGKGCNQDEQFMEPSLVGCSCCKAGEDCSVMDTCRFIYRLSQGIYISTI